MPRKHCAKWDGDTGRRLPSRIPFRPNLSQPIQKKRSLCDPHMLEQNLSAHANGVRSHQGIEGKCLCALGEFSIMPVVTGIKHFRSDYEAHIGDGR